MGETRCFQCIQCGRQYNEFMLYAFEGNTYCPVCKPDGAQSACNLRTFEDGYGPEEPEMTPEQWEAEERTHEEAERIYEADRARFPYSWER